MQEILHLSSTASPTSEPNLGCHMPCLRIFLVAHIVTRTEVPRDRFSPGLSSKRLGTYDLMLASGVSHLISQTKIEKEGKYNPDVNYKRIC